ncbi:NAD(P)-dependent dehydrogenase (short-subunit alcohol dehydrogenase family) [Rhizobium aquaticum]|uniref:NAD(P)-dependent dehydrogenase (Short-subunit alcohol dehydrogenase family) n=1 Tax=Rhizobium aquaticum TaxID=1549636 RepID=A0ABV2J1G4_9HYPH
MSTIVITGAGRGIGHELARAALAEGHTVYGSVRSEADAAKLQCDLGEALMPLVFDVTDRAAVSRTAASVAGPVDILINNAGIIGPRPERQSPLAMDFDGFAETLAINTIAPLAVSQAFLPALRRSDRGRILTISSQMSFMGYRKSDQIAYRASKAAVNKVMQGLATALEDEKIPVVLVDPGWVKTDMGGPSADLDPAQVAAGILSLAEALGMPQTGRFFLWSGQERGF